MKNQQGGFIKGLIITVIVIGIVIIALIVMVFTSLNSAREEAVENRNSTVPTSSINNNSSSFAFVEKMKNDLGLTGEVVNEQGKYKVSYENTSENVSKIDSYFRNKFGQASSKSSEKLKL